MPKDTALRDKAVVPLRFPVTVPGGDGKPAERSSLTMRRPKLRHAKRLVVILGKDLLNALLGDEPVLAKEVDGRKVLLELAAALTDPDRLDSLSDLVADMCGETKEVIDDLDLLDLATLAAEFAGFFPELPSKAAGMSQAISAAISGAPKPT